MNLPNKLTVGRIVLVPFLVATLLIDFPLNNLAALLIFAVASVTDLLDGKIARKQNLITDFGKFADPLADKILVLAALLCFVQMSYCDCIAVIIVLFREFAVTSIRLIAASKGKVVAANIWGKAKTVSQMIAVIAIMVLQIIIDITQLANSYSADVAAAFWIVNEILLWISTVFAIISGIIYIVQNKEFISEF